MQQDQGGLPQAVGQGHAPQRALGEGQAQPGVLRLGVFGSQRQPAQAAVSLLLNHLIVFRQVCIAAEQQGGRVRNRIRRVLDDELIQVFIVNPQGCAIADDGLRVGFAVRPEKHGGAAQSQAPPADLQLRASLVCQALLKIGGEGLQPLQKGLQRIRGRCRPGGGSEERKRQQEANRTSEESSQAHGGRGGPRRVNPQGAGDRRGFPGCRWLPEAPPSQRFPFPPPGWRRGCSLS